MKLHKTIEKPEKETLTHWIVSFEQDNYGLSIKTSSPDATLCCIQHFIHAEKQRKCNMPKLERLSNNLKDNNM